MKRDERIDSVAGIMISYMVFTHVCQHYHLELSSFYIVGENLLYFFMPWFFFKAGMFFKVGNNKDVIIKSSKRLLKPFLIYSLAGHICCCFLSYVHGNLTLSTLIPYRSLLLTGSIPGNLPLWFLLSLFGCRVIFNFAMSRKLSAIAVASFSLVGACLLHVIGFNHPYYVTNIMTGLFFLSLGYIITKRSVITPPILAICIVIYILSLIYPSFVGMRSNHLYYGVYLLWILYSCAGIIVINKIANKAEKLFSCFKAIGKYSMQIYCIHWIPLMFL